MKGITALDELPVAADKAFNASIPFSRAAVQLSDPTLYTNISFPFVGPVVLTRFKVDLEDVRRKSSYMGREKFAKLVERFEEIWKS